MAREAPAELSWLSEALWCSRMVCLPVKKFKGVPVFTAERDKELRDQLLKSKAKAPELVVARAYVDILNQAALLKQGLESMGVDVTRGSPTEDKLQLVKSKPWNEKVVDVDGAESSTLCSTAIIPFEGFEAADPVPLGGFPRILNHVYTAAVLHKKIRTQTTWQSS